MCLRYPLQVHQDHAIAGGQRVLCTSFALGHSTCSHQSRTPTNGRSNDHAHESRSDSDESAQSECQVHRNPRFLRGDKQTILCELRTLWRVAMAQRWSCHSAQREKWMDASIPILRPRNGAETPHSCCTRCDAPVRLRREDPNPLLPSSTYTINASSICLQPAQRYYHPTHNRRRHTCPDFLQKHDTVYRLLPIAQYP